MEAKSVTAPLCLRIHVFLTFFVESQLIRRQLEKYERNLDEKKSIETKGATNDGLAL